MGRRVAIPLLAALLVSCTKTVYVPVERVTTVTVTERDTVVEVLLERELVNVKTQDTVAFAETQYSEATAVWQGETATLSLRMENKKFKIPTRTKYIERLIVDSVPAPYPVEVVRTEYSVHWYDRAARWIALSFGVAVLIFILVLWSRR